MKRYLVVFAKEPMLGRVKTRLKGFSDMQRLNLYKAFLKDTLNIAKKIRCEKKILAFDSQEKPRYLKTIGRSFQLYKQKGRNLGYRINNIMLSLDKNEEAKVVIIGSDSPTLPAKYIQRAFYELDKYDIVIGPSLDGGYYLIGFKKACPAIFKNIQWGKETVFRDTIKNVRSLNKRLKVLKKWYDVDRLEDLQLLKRDLIKNKNIAEWTRRYLKI